MPPPTPPNHLISGYPPGQAVGQFGTMSHAPSAIRHKRHSAPLVVGVDVGGTWTRVNALQGGRLVMRSTVPATRAHEITAFLRRVWKQRGWTPTRVGALVVASRGIWTRRERGVLAQRLRGLARRVGVFSDAQAAFLGALGPQPGVLILSGTGSIAVGRNARGRWERAGGLGPLLGDEGSAFWLGREWLRATTRGEDFAPARRIVRTPDPIARIAHLAPAVCRRARRRDHRARIIVAAAQVHLAGLILAVVRRLRLTDPVRISWAGSVLGDAYFRAGLRRAVTRAGLRARWLPPTSAPVVAATRLAARLASGEGGSTRVK